jgi:phage terminase Nu1 subunit (DNA packaging protein)
MNNDDIILKRKELAKYLRIDYRKIVQYEKEGMPVINLGEKTKRYNLDKVLDWFDEMNDLARDIN